MSDMEKQEYKSKWDELARVIGAEIPPETEQREEAVSAAPAQSHVTPQPTKPIPAPPVAPKKSPANWDMLAGELGLPPIEPPAPPKVAEARPAPEAIEPTRDMARDIAEPQRRERPDRPQRRDSREQRPARQEQRREPPNQNRERTEPRRQQPERQRERPATQSERPERQRERPETRREQPQRRRPPRELADDVSSKDETTRAPVEQSPPGPPVERRPAAPQQNEELPKPPAVSLWHKIFGLPPEQTAKLSERSPAGDDEDDARSQDQRPFGASDSWTSVDVAREEVTTDFIEEERVQGDADSRATEEGDSSEPNRGRPRRRRRGGRGRKSSERPTDGPRRAPRQAVSRSADEINEDTDLDSDDDDLTLGDPALMSADDDSDTEDSDDGDMEAGGSVRSRSAAQRAIPSWDEAIGYIVDANMQSRPQRRGSARPDSRPNSPRGRSRGRRSR